MNRRGLLHGILAAGMAPAIVRAEILMPVRKIILPAPLIGGEVGTVLIPLTESAYQAALNRMFREMLDNCRIASEAAIAHSASVWKELRR